MLPDPATLLPSARDARAPLFALVVCAGALLGTAFALGYHCGRPKAAPPAEVHHAQALEDAHKAELSAAKALAEERGREVQRLKGLLASLPADPGPAPVPPDLKPEPLLAELESLGLHPVRLGDPLAVGLTLPDGITTLEWGRQALRVGPLSARVEAYGALVSAQEGENTALHLSLTASGKALEAADRRAALLSRELDRRGPVRPWSAGLLAGVDLTGGRRWGAYVSRSFGPVDVQAVVLGNQVALGGGIRF